MQPAFIRDCSLTVRSLRGEKLLADLCECLCVCVCVRGRDLIGRHFGNVGGRVRIRRFMKQVSILFCSGQVTHQSPCSQRCWKGAGHSHF